MRHIAAYCVLFGLSLGAWPCTLLGQVIPALPRAVFADDSIIARDALLRVRELAGVGNVGEALRVLQGVLETESDKVLPSNADPDLFVPVRGLAHELLLSDPALLAKYRELEGPQAELQLARGQMADVERTRFLTPAGFEASLRLAQAYFEAARFEAAFLSLEALDKHPDRQGDKGKDASLLLNQVARFLADPQVRQFAQRWETQAGLPTTTWQPAPAAPALAAVAQTSLWPGPAIDLAEFGPKPLQELAIEALADAGDEQPGKVSWVLPSVAGERLYFNDGVWVRCVDAATLTPLWAQRPDRGMSRFLARSDQVFGLLGLQQGFPDDVSTVSVANGVAITAGGVAEGGARELDRRVHALDSRTGRPLWSADVSTLDPRLEETVAMGPIVIDGDLAIVTLRKTNVSKRVNALYLAGVDLYTGTLRWWRLVASVGTNPWGRAQIRPDATLLDRGVVYRADEMGVVGAYRADNGRPVWVRLGTGAPRGLDPQQIRMFVPTPAYQIMMPVRVGESLYLIEPGRGRLIELDVHSGALRASRDASAVGNPKYLLRVGDQLALVGVSNVAFVPFGNLSNGKVRVTTGLDNPKIVGRACVAGDRLLVPLDGQLVVISPDEPEHPTRVDASGMGNLVIAQVAGAPAHILAADSDGLSSYMKWERAEALLDARIAQHPLDPEPLLTSLELLKRAGEFQAVPGLADRVLKLIEPDATSTRAGALRGRLFDLLLGILRGAATTMNASAQAASGAAPAGVDLAQLDAVAARLERCAESPDQLAALSFQIAWVREAQNRPELAIEAYQRVLLDPELSGLRPDWLESDEDGSSSSPLAGEEASRQVQRVLRKAGFKAYAAFDEEALALFRESSAKTPEELLSLARRYPAAGVTPEIYLAAAEGFAKRGGVTGQRRALAAGLGAAGLSAAIGRVDESQTVARLAGALVLASPELGQLGALYRSLVRLAKERPGLAIESGGVTTPVEQVTQSILVRLSARPALPAIGPEISPEVQAIASWEPVEALLRTAKGLSCDSLMMYSQSRHQVALWGVRGEDHQLRPIWSRPARLRPSVLRVDPQTALLFWPSARGGVVECVGLDGETRWRTDELGALFGPPADANERIPTPMDGQVRPDDLLFAISRETLCLVQRCGKAAGVSLATGETLWNRTLPCARVYEVTSVGELVMVGGSMASGEGATPWAAFVGAIDPRQGEIKGSLTPAQVGDHPRWIREIPGGDALVGTSEGVIRFDPGTGTVRWEMKSPVVRTSIAAWVLSKSAYLLDGDVGLQHLDLATGKLAPMGPAARGKLTLPVVSSATASSLALGSTRGMIVLDDAGSLVGADAMEDQARIEPPAFGEGFGVAIEAPDRELGSPEGEGFVARLYVLERPTGRLAALERVRLFDAPQSLTVLDGKVLIGQGAMTIVLDAGWPDPTNSEKATESPKASDK